MDMLAPPYGECAVDGLCGSRWRRLNTGHGEGNKLRRNNNSNTGAAPERQDDEEGETFTAGVRAIWQRPTCAGSLAKDLPRLARRITVKTRTGRDVLPPSPGQARAMGPVETWGLIEGLVITLVGEMEAHRTVEVESGLRDIASRVTATTELEMAMPELIRLLGEESKALKALKMVDQGVVLLGVHHMKGGVTKGLLTKDVRSAEGWQIGIDVFEHVQVYHKRREQSVDIVNGAQNHFELDFEVRATFDRGMNELTAAGLRVQRLVCAPTMQLEMRVQLESRILGDLIIL